MLQRLRTVQGCWGGQGHGQDPSSTSIQHSTADISLPEKKICILKMTGTCLSINFKKGSLAFSSTGLYGSCAHSWSHCKVWWWLWLSRWWLPGVARGGLLCCAQWILATTFASWTVLDGPHSWVSFAVLKLWICPWNTAILLMVYLLVKFTCVFEYPTYTPVNANKADDKLLK